MCVFSRIFLVWCCLLGNGVKLIDCLMVMFCVMVGLIMFLVVMIWFVGMLVMLWLEIMMMLVLLVRLCVCRLFSSCLMVVLILMMVVVYLGDFGLWLWLVWLICFMYSVIRWGVCGLFWLS